VLFGAGPLKLGNILGKSSKVGARNKKIFMETYKPHALLVAKLEDEFKESGNKYITALDGRRLFVRSKKDVLNTFTQGNAAIIFKHWMLNCAKISGNFPTESHQIIA
jgi:hypothetical protein